MSLFFRKQQDSNEQGTARVYTLAENTVCYQRPACSQLYMIYQGNGGGLPPSFNRPEFAKVTGIYERNLLLFRDPMEKFYLRGISPKVSDMAKFIAWQQRIRESELPHVRTTYCLGISSGAYAAIASGYYLKVPVVWALGLPVSQVNFMDQLQDPVSKLCTDLAELLREGNGYTEYRMFYTQGFNPDCGAAERLANCPGVRLFPQKGVNHFVVGSMFESGAIRDMFLPLEYTDLS